MVLGQLFEAGKLAHDANEPAGDALTFLFNIVVAFAMEEMTAFVMDANAIFY